MKKVYLIIAVVLCLVPVVAFSGGIQRQLMQMTGMYSAASGDSQLYTDAKAIWRFNGDLTDEKGNHDLAAGDAPSYDPDDKKGGTHSGDFNGTSDYVTTADHADLDIFLQGGGDSAVAFWVKWNAINNFDRVFTKFDTAWGQGFMLYDDTNDAVFNFDAVGTDYNFDTDGGLQVATGTWYHVCVSFDDSTDIATIWVGTAAYNDGINGDTAADFGGSSAHSGDPFEVGAYDNTKWFDGHLDDFAIWKQTIDATDCNAHFSSPEAW